MISEQDIPGFFATPAELNLEDYVLLKYIFQTRADPRFAAASLCSEQSTAQWKRVGVEEDLRARHGAKVISLNECRGDPCDRPEERANTPIRGQARFAPTGKFYI